MYNRVYMLHVYCISSTSVLLSAYHFMLTRFLPFSRLLLQLGVCACGGVCMGVLRRRYASVCAYCFGNCIQRMRRKWYLEIWKCTFTVSSASGDKKQTNSRCCCCNWIGLHRQIKYSNERTRITQQVFRLNLVPLSTPLYGLTKKKKDLNAIACLRGGFVTEPNICALFGTAAAIAINIAKERNGRTVNRPGGLFLCRHTYMRITGRSRSFAHTIRFRTDMHMCACVYFRGEYGNITCVVIIRTLTWHSLSLHQYFFFYSIYRLSVCLCLCVYNFEFVFCRCRFTPLTFAKSLYWQTGHTLVATISVGRSKVKELFMKCIRRTAINPVAHIHSLTVANRLYAIIIWSNERVFPSSLPSLLLLPSLSSTFSESKYIFVLYIVRAVSGFSESCSHLYQPSQLSELDHEHIKHFNNMTNVEYVRNKNEATQNS